MDLGDLYNGLNALDVPLITRTPGGEFTGLREGSEQLPIVTAETDLSGVNAILKSGDKNALSLMYSDVIASRALVLADAGQVLKCNSGSAIVLTITNDTTGLWEGNDGIAAYQAGAGAVSFAAGSGVTLRGTAPTAAQYSTQGVMRVGTNEWAYL